MKKQERKEMIVEILRRENGLPVRILANQLDVSHMTVRRDVEELVAEDLVRIIHGGVILSPSLTRGGNDGAYSLHDAGSEQSEVKERIGKKAAGLIAEGDTLIIDSGSTSECIARNLPGDRNLTVLSYALNIITRTAGMERVQSVFAGGTLHPNLLMFESPEGLSLIKRFRATKAFVSAAGVSLDLGVTCRNAYERETKTAVLESSAHRILVADSSKFGEVRSDYFAEIGEFDVVVSDSGLDGAVVRELEGRGLEVILA